MEKSPQETGSSFFVLRSSFFVLRSSFFVLRSSFFVLFWLMLTFISCKKNIQEVNLLDQSETPIAPENMPITKEVRSRLDLLTFVVMDVLEDNPQLKNEVLKQINVNRLSTNSESVYFKDLLIGNGQFSKDFAKNFKLEIVKRIESGDFPFVNRVEDELDLVRQKGKKELVVNLSSDADFLNWDLNYLTMAHLGSRIYFPYSEDFTSSSSLPVFYTHDPVNPQLTQTEVYWNSGQQYSSDYVSGNDEWAMKNPTLVLLLDDNIAGNHLLKFRNSPCARGSFMTPLCESELYYEPPTTQVDSIRPIPIFARTNYSGPLENNIAPSALSSLTNDKYLFTATIPDIRLVKNLRKNFWDGDNELFFHRSRAKIANPDEEDFRIAVVADTPYRIFHERIGRKQANNGIWRKITATYTTSWGQEQENNYVALSYRGHWAKPENIVVNFKLAAGVYWDTTRIPIKVTDPSTGITVETYRQRGWVPVSDRRVSIDGQLRIGKFRRLEGDMLFTRASFLGEAIGNNFGKGTSRDFPGLDHERAWAIRGIGSKFEFYWRVQSTY